MECHFAEVRVDSLHAEYCLARTLLFQLVMCLEIEWQRVPFANRRCLQRLGKKDVTKKTSSSDVEEETFQPAKEAKCAKLACSWP